MDGTPWYSATGLNVTVEQYFSFVDAGDADGLLRFALRGNDTVVGSNGNDGLAGFAGSDTLNGGSGNDRLDGGQGGDHMTGGTGNDTFVVDSSSDSVVEAFNAGTDSVRSSVSFVLPDHVENLVLTGTGNINGTGNELGNAITGNAGNNGLNGGLGADVLGAGAGADLLNGGGGADTLSGGTGADRVFGGGGADTLGGGKGNDSLVGDAGNDTMMGGDGNDVFFVESAGDRAIETSDPGVDTVRSSVSFVLSDNVERLVLTGIVDIDGTGNGLNNLVTGNGADNILGGAGGADILNGGGGADTLSGGTDDDSLAGNSGNDTMFGGAGIDSLNGGDGADDFRYADAGDGSVVALNADPVGAGDAVVGFATGVDEFVFVAAAFGFTAGDPVAEGTNFETVAGYDGTNATSAEYAGGNDAFIFDSTNGKLIYDGNGNADGYTVIADLDAGAVAAGDIVLV
jgi:Ca2+-binding RTX toxin-like protein